MLAVNLAHVLFCNFASGNRLNDRLKFFASLSVFCTFLGCSGEAQQQDNRKVVYFSMSNAPAELRTTLEALGLYTIKWKRSSVRSGSVRVDYELDCDTTEPSILTFHKGQLGHVYIRRRVETVKEESVDTSEKAIKRFRRFFNSHGKLEVERVSFGIGRRWALPKWVDGKRYVEVYATRENGNWHAAKFECKSGQLISYQNKL